MPEPQRGEAGVEGPGRRAAAVARALIRRAATYWTEQNTNTPSSATNMRFHCSGVSSVADMPAPTASASPVASSVSDANSAETCLAVSGVAGGGAIGAGSAGGGEAGGSVAVAGIR